MKMRLAWYAGASTALAAAVVASAFYQRANFYSAMVHLAQSSLSLMVLVNLIFLVYGSFMYGLQRLCFGPLRPTEIEQLYEKGWFAVTETCLAMTIFREEVGAFFLVMFTALVTGKVWGWIGEGRVEVLEQQPPANPRLFHTRLAISLFVSIAYDIWMLSYAVNTVVREARPSMMVMFLFEFAVLTVCSLHTTSRYIISLLEQRVIKTQTRQRLEERRRHVREQRAEILRRRETEGATEGDNEELPDENDVDEMDIEVPGWEAKGHWVLSLDLFADFIKLGIYTTFFCVLLTFYGLPIHIIRDWFMTTRSFLKRLHALIRYRQALKNMDQYPDATAEELGREDTCIICREEMRPWNSADVTQVERSRAKKLPCGHILHFGCLKSWLERQQVCPTCRRPVSQDGQQQRPNGGAMVFRLGLNLPGGQNRQAQPPANGQAPGGQPAQGGAANEQGNNNQNRNVRMFNLGPLRLGFAQGGVDEIREMAQRLRVPADGENPPVPTPTIPAQETNNNTALGLDQMRAQLTTLGQQVRQDMQNAQIASQELGYMNLLMAELARLRQFQQPQGQQQAAQQTPGAAHGGQVPLPHHTQGLPNPFTHVIPPGIALLPTQGNAHIPPNSFSPFLQPGTVTRHTGAGQGGAIPAGSPELPEGVVIPPGWSLLPLQRMDAGAEASAALHNHHRAPATAPHDILHPTHIPQVPNNPWSRHTSPAPGGGLFPPAARPGPPSPNASEPHPAPTAPGTASSDTAGREQHAVPPVTAPIPRAPNWGGPAQLFGGQGAPTVFGYQRVHTPEPPHEPEQSSGEGPATDAAVNGVAAETSNGGSQAAEEGAVNGGTSSRAVTVEEAEDEEGGR